MRIFQTAYVRKVRSRARPGPSCQPSGQPGGQEKLTGQKELAWRAEKALPGEGISRENLEAAGASGRKVVSRSYQDQT